MKGECATVPQREGAITISDTGHGGSNEEE